MKRDRWQRGVAASDEPFFFSLSSSSSLFASMLLRFNRTLSFGVSLMSFACLPTSISAPRLRPHGTRLHAPLAVRTVITQQHTVVRKPVSTLSLSCNSRLPLHIPEDASGDSMFLFWGFFYFFYQDSGQTAWALLGLMCRCKKRKYTVVPKVLDQ